MKKIGVVGIGNILMGDDGFGPYVIKVMESRFSEPEGLCLLELGTPGFDLASHIAGFDVVIVVDTVKTKGAFGELKRYERPELLIPPKRGVETPHDPGLKESLLSLQAFGSLPSEVVLIGAIPEQVLEGTGLTKPIKDSVEPAIKMVLDELKRFGVSLLLRTPPLEPDIWWDRGK